MFVLIVAALVGAIFLINPIVDYLMVSNRTELLKKEKTENLSGVKKDKQEYYDELLENNEYKKAYNVGISCSLEDVLDDGEKIPFTQWSEDKMDYIIEHKIEDITTEIDAYGKAYKIAENCDNKNYMYMTKMFKEESSFDQFLLSCPLNSLTMKNMETIGDYFEKKEGIEGTNQDGYYEFDKDNFFGKVNNDNNFSYDFEANVSGTESDDDIITSIVVTSSEDEDGSSGKAVYKRGVKWLSAIKKTFGVKSKDMRIKTWKNKKTTKKNQKGYRITYKWKKDGKKYTFIREYNTFKNKKYGDENILYIDTKYHNKID